MEENRSQAKHKHGTQHGGPALTRRNKRNNTSSGGGDATTAAAASSAIDGGGDLVECSGKHCRSCTAGLIADCVALCCCPCALLNLLALAFVKLPWMVGRKCLTRVKKKRKSSSSSRERRKCKKSNCNLEAKAQDKDCDHQSNSSGGSAMADDGGNKDENLRKRRAKDGILEYKRDGCGEEDDENGRFEDVEKVWLEMYKDGHLSFGRVSFSGIQ